MEIFQLVGIDFITAVAALILKNTKPELAFAVTVTGSIILLLFTFEMLKSSLAIFQKIAETTGLDSSLIKIHFFEIPRPLFPAFRNSRRSIFFRLC